MKCEMGRCGWGGGHFVEYSLLFNCAKGFCWGNWKVVGIRICAPVAMLLGVLSSRFLELALKLKAVSFLWVNHGALTCAEEICAIFECTVATSLRACTFLSVSWQQRL